MWRAFFLAIGFSVMILGVECLGVETIKLKTHEAPPPAASPFVSAPAAGPQRVVTPPKWAPWSLMASGAIVCLYSFTIPARFKSKK